jgi:hypothetical protein
VESLTGRPSSQRGHFRLAASLLVAGLLGSCQSIQSRCQDDERIVDGRCQSKPASCGSQPTIPGCGWTQVPADCLGAWTCSYLDPTNCWCSCPTSDEGCPCWDDEHCEGTCVAPKEGPACKDTYTGETGKGSRYGVVFGCSCYFHGGIPFDECWD